MLDPIDTAAVISGDRIQGIFPGQIHQGAAWWIGACFVMTQNARHIAVTHNEHSVIAEFARRFRRGAMN